GALDAEVDAEQTCSITSAEGDSTGLRITVTKVNDDDVDYDTELFLTADEVASGTEAGLVDQGYEVSSVTCDDELVGEVGNSVVCTVTDSEGEYDIESTVSAIDGLRFSLEFADVA
ncbi:MAG: DUF4333 domain-containing protein, partial [Actinobacteria bacterium]|nr:DUF4333 domain-containing protein [Actinomycetota bacterium]